MSPSNRDILPSERDRLPQEVIFRGSLFSSALLDPHGIRRCCLDFVSPLQEGRIMLYNSYSVLSELRPLPLTLKIEQQIYTDFHAGKPFGFYLVGATLAFSREGDA